MKKPLKYKIIRKYAKYDCFYSKRIKQGKTHMIAIFAEHDGQEFFSNVFSINPEELKQKVNKILPEIIKRIEKYETEKV